MKNKSYLIVGGSLNFFIAFVHLVAIFIGAPAYEFLDAPAFALYAEMGSSIPSWITFFVMLIFILFGLYAFCAAGEKVKMPMQRPMLKVIAYLFLLRGLAVFWFIYLKIFQMPYSSSKEIGFSLFALMVGILYFLGIQSPTPQRLQNTE